MANWHTLTRKMSSDEKGLVEKTLQRCAWLDMRDTNVALAWNLVMGSRFIIFRDWKGKVIMEGSPPSKSIFNDGLEFGFNS